jgi:hypothetical protein
LLKYTHPIGNICVVQQEWQKAELL